MERRPARVSLEGLNNPDAADGSWPALVERTTWNGWAVPWFDAATAAAIVAALDSQPGATAAIGPDAVEVVTEESEFPEEVFTAETIDGQPWYPIGACAWCWTLAPPSRPASPS